MSRDRRALLDRYMNAFEAADPAALRQLLREDVELEMPPFSTWFAGRDAVGSFLSAQVLGRSGQFRMVATTANGQLATAGYVASADGVYHAHGLQVLSVASSGIGRIVVFLDESLFPIFGLPLSCAGDPDCDHPVMSGTRPVPPPVGAFGLLDEAIGLRSGRRPYREPAAAAWPHPLRRVGFADVGPAPQRCSRRTRGGHGYRMHQPARRR